MKKNGKGKKGCLVLAALAALCMASSVASAEDVPILSSKRLAFAAQVGTDWRRGTTLDTGFQSKPAVKLVPIYRLYGPESGLARGSIALSFPAKVSLTREREAEFGAYLSIILWDGSDR